MEKRIFFLFFFINTALFSQTMSISDEIFIGSAEGYGIVGKLNDRILFFTLDDSKVKIRALDGKLHKLWEKEVIPDRKNQSKVLEVLGNKQDFNVIYQYRKKGHNYIKVHKYDGQVKLLDSVTVHDWGREIVSPTLQITYSEDRRMALIYETESFNKINALAVSLDSMKKLWYASFDSKGWEDNENFTQTLINNKGEAFFITEENNRIGSSNKHIYNIRQVGVYGTAKTYQIPFENYVSIDTKFSFDNANNKLVASGLYAGKNYSRAQGFFFLNITPQLDNYKTALHAFDDEFVSAVQGKKITDNKGINDLKIREIAHKRDGGILAVIEEIKEVARGSATYNRTFYSNRDFRIAMDYFYDNVYAISINSDGTIHWKSIFYKKQISQDDDARFCSYFLFKTPTALRFLFNDEIERSTTVSEYILSGSGESERHTIYNTEGQNLTLRFRDAMQIAANEMIVPSDDRRRVKLMKIEY
jgi:hypothetical protein